MKLIRFATVFLNLKPSGQENISFEAGEVSVDVQNVSSGEETRLLLQAAISLNTRPEVSSQGEVAVPEQPRKEAEAVIETVANVLAVLNHSPRRISSPHPFVALFLEGEEEQSWASGLSRFVGHHSGIPRTTYRLPSSPEYLAALSDRMDGAALLAEAITHEHATGKFHEFMRLFERAFALSPSQFEKKLAQFLQGADLGYDRNEVKRWIELRNPATHANDPVRSFIALESDVRPVIARMEQAAYDVLWNKKSWQNSSRERRQVWLPTVATISPTYDVMIIKGLDASFMIQMLDPFKAFPCDAGFHLPEFPPHLWASWPGTVPAFSGAMRVREQPGNTQPYEQQTSMS
jgi:hypothetical protein